MTGHRRGVRSRSRSRTGVSREQGREGEGRGVRKVIPSAWSGRNDLSITLIGGNCDTKYDSLDWSGEQESPYGNQSNYEGNR